MEKQTVQRYITCSNVIIYSREKSARESKLVVLDTKPSAFRLTRTICRLGFLSICISCPMFLGLQKRECCLSFVSQSYSLSYKD